MLHGILLLLREAHVITNDEDRPKAPCAKAADALTAIRVCHRLLLGLLGLPSR
jgi:hypothetical protein